MPTAAWDRANIEKMKACYPGYTFYCIDMRTFDRSGGSIHCITKQIPADNPMRIIHKDIYGDVNPVMPNATEQFIPFSAIITNKSGIKEASLCYAIDGKQWSEIKLMANGKTVTKLVNALKGNLYGFTITSAVKFDKDMFDYTTEPTPTGIVEVRCEMKEGRGNGWYTISGMPLSQKPATKGIYIYNGKKVAIK